MVKDIAIGTGRRKTAVARVFMREGSGKIVVNGNSDEKLLNSLQNVKILEIKDNILLGELV